MKHLFIWLLVLLCFQNGLAKRIRTEKDITNQMIKHAQNSQSEDDVAEYKQILATLSSSNKSSRCLTCRSVAQMVMDMYKLGSSIDEITTYMINLCITMRIETPAVCQGITPFYAPIVEYILKNQPLLNAISFCGVLLQSQENSCPYSDERYEWTIDIPEKSETIKKKELPLSGHSSKPFKVLHITDIHYDPAYEPGGVAGCEEPICCRENQTEKSLHRRKPLDYGSEKVNTVYLDENGMMFIDLDENKDAKATIRTVKQEKSEPAGFWGDYRKCDAPWWAFVDLMDRVAEHQDIDFVYYTGDTVDHGEWETSKSLVTNTFNDILNKFKEVFGDKPVYYVIGNHDAHPVNQFAPPDVTDPEVSTRWLYELLFNKWNSWLPSDTKESILTGGYYTTLAKPGLRIVVLNSNLCYTSNWWIHLDPRDPSGQLKWLTETLYKAEKAGERVHILSHIPPSGTDYYYICNREYVKIIQRFSDTIVAELNGHTHADEFKVFYDSNMQKPLLVAWNNGGFTTFIKQNPNYRIFEVDGDTFDFIDFHTYIYNLTEANLVPERRPRWFKSYSFKENYGVKSLAASDIDNLIHRMVTTDKKLLKHDYHIFKGKISDSTVSSECGDTCVKSSLLYMVDTDMHDTSKSDYFWKIYSETNP